MQQKKILITWKEEFFPIKNLDKISTCEPTPEWATEQTKYKKSKLKLQPEFMNEIIADKKWNVLELF